MQVKFSWRTVVLAGVVFAHAIALALLMRYERPVEQDVEPAFRVEFIEAPIVIRPPPIVVTPPTPQRKHSPRPIATRPEVAPPLQVVETPPPQSLYEPDGRLRLPADLMEQIDRQFGDQRQFDFQVPGLNDGAKAFDRPTALAYEPTRFAQYWKPDQDLLNDLLSRAVEATTKEIRIPVPGKPREHIVCKISVLAMGGGCGIEVAGGNYVGPKDDPNTLSPEEDRQCKAWWDKIVGAKTQDEWRATRQIYELECRKPLERKPSG